MTDMEILQVMKNIMKPMNKKMEDLELKIDNLELKLDSMDLKLESLKLDNKAEHRAIRRDVRCFLSGQAGQEDAPMNSKNFPDKILRGFRVL